MELVDTLALGASAFGREGSSPFLRTREITHLMMGYFSDSQEGPNLKLCVAKLGSVFKMKQKKANLKSLFSFANEENKRA